MGLTNCCSSCFYLAFLSIPNGSSVDEISGLTDTLSSKMYNKNSFKKYKYPYLLRDLKIERPNQVWAIDITYIPMEKGFMYLFAIIDVYSRYVVGWSVKE